MLRAVIWHLVGGDIGVKVKNFMRLNYLYVNFTISFIQMYSLVSYLFMLMKTSIGFRLLGDGDLMIVNGNESHEGKYLCQANNGVGSGKSKLISINVDGKSCTSERVIMGPNRF